MSHKQVAKNIFSDALEVSLPKNFIPKMCGVQEDVLYIGDEGFALLEYKNIYVFGSGKAAYTMAFEIEKLLGAKIYKGLVVGTQEEKKLQYIEVEQGGHPLPTQESLNATKKLIDMMQECTEDDLYIYLLSGGSSALIELPIEPITLEEMQETTEFMLHNALDIQAMNSVRKHISQIKGGRLAKMCKAQGLVLVLSDIIDNDLYSIGSAPLYADKSSFEDAKNVLMQKDIFYTIPQSVQEVLEKGVSQCLEETPTEPDENVKHFILASNDLALDAAKRSAEANGLSCTVFPQAMQGDVVEMVDTMLDSLKNLGTQAILFGGECTVTLRGDGMGGRNQHAVALMLKELYNRVSDICFLSAGTDGIDGNSPSAGAVVETKDTQKIGLHRLEEYIENFDSYNLHKELGTLVQTGASGTNVIDIAILIQGE